MARSTFSIEQLKRELKLREKEIKILQQISRTVSSNLNLDDVLNQIIRVVVKVSKADACLLYLLNKDTQELVLRASHIPHPEALGKIKLKLGEGITGTVALKKEPVAISKNAKLDKRFIFFKDLPEDEYEAFLSVPIISKDEVIGVINIKHKKPHQHTKEEIALLSTIAQQVGSAIENAQLYEAVQKKAAQLDMLSQISKTIVSNQYLKEILQLIVAITAQTMGSKICSIMLLDEKKQELFIVATQSLSQEYVNKPPLKVGESISGKAVQEKKPITVLDVRNEPGYVYPEIAKKEGLVSLLSVPMMIKDKVIGVVNIYTSFPHRFTNEEINLLQVVANQAAVAIENTKLIEETLALKEALETRKIIERAKGILMKELNLSEDEAHRLINKKSMDMRKSMREIAEAIILSSDLLSSEFKKR